MPPPSRDHFERVLCPVCRALLFRADPETIGTVEIKCHNCRNIKAIRLPRNPVVLRDKSEYSESAS